MTGFPKLPAEPRADEASMIGIKTKPTVDTSDDALRVLDETLQVSKRQVAAGTVRVSTRTETYNDVAEVTLDHDVVDVIRVPVDRVVDEAPGIRTEGARTVVPVVEERFVIVKQLDLKEELHIRRHVERETSRIPVQLRRQTAVVERLDESGDAREGSSVSAPSTNADPAFK